jgi:predicted AAA+ superfamily ATPase
VEAEEVELFRKAEAFAIRANGRSPRTAKQFIQLLYTGLK